jgi:hypothetical protein
MVKEYKDFREEAKQDKNLVYAMEYTSLRTAIGWPETHPSLSHLGRDLRELNDNYLANVEQLLERAGFNTDQPMDVQVRITKARRRNSNKISKDGRWILLGK